MRVRPRVVVLSLLGLVVVGALLLLYSRELFGVDGGPVGRIHATSI